MLIRSGLLLSLMAVFLQIAVFLQPLLPKAYQVAPVCETITRALLLPVDHSVHGHAHSEHLHSQHQPVISDDGHNHHDANHQCQYCTVYGNLVLPPELSVKEVLDRIQVRFIAFEKAFQHVWFALQRLFLIPQGRAPPLFA
ncbi:DUF2946 family protein [Acinetobacter indicus]|uniref:DUF2946 family protein n=1 Tax=Acinetobacter indicus TaxID=756892 RepID=UPI00209B56B7|nr:DUF2946 family protein [Acinetobacter indicus]MCO8100862.1 DUF2946 family protein [Acinetobacter indicus]MCO8106393.1 DUF2946 family protein [Acinetobacter indicus]MCO8112094.1 DUF2946 family protein [Acinetobacter indicus]